MRAIDKARTAWDYAKDEWDLFERGADVHCYEVHRSPTLGAIGPVHGRRIAVLGPVHGYWTRVLAGRGARVTAVGWAEGPLGIARQSRIEDGVLRDPSGNVLSRGVTGSMEFVPVESAPGIATLGRKSGFDLVLLPMTIEAEPDAEEVFRALGETTRAVVLSMRDPMAELGYHEGLTSREDLEARGIGGLPFERKWDIPGIRPFTVPNWVRPWSALKAALEANGYRSIEQFPVPPPSAELVEQYPRLRTAAGENPRFPYTVVRAEVPKAWAVALDVGAPATRALVSPGEGADTRWRGSRIAPSLVKGDDGRFVLAKPGEVIDEVRDLGTTLRAMGVPNALAPEYLSRLFSELSGVRWAVAFDYDNTVVPRAAEFPDPEARAVIRRNIALGIPHAVVSTRPLGFLQERLNLPELHYYGVSGAESSSPPNHDVDRLEFYRRLVNWLAAAGPKLASQFTRRGLDDPAVQMLLSSPHLSPKEAARIVADPLGAGLMDVSDSTIAFFTKWVDPNILESPESLERLRAALEHMTIQGFFADSTIQEFFERSGFMRIGELGFLQGKHAGELGQIEIHVRPPRTLVSKLITAQKLKADLGVERVLFLEDNPEEYVTHPVIDPSITRMLVLSPYTAKRLDLSSRTRPPVHAFLEGVPEVIRFERIVSNVYGTASRKRARVSQKQAEFARWPARLVPGGGNAS